MIGAGWLLLAAALGCRPPGESLEFPSERISTLTVNVLRITEAEQSETTEIYFGQLTPQRESRLAFRVGGQVKSIQAIGTRVPAGEVLAELEQAELEQQKSELESQRDALRQASPTLAPPTGPATPSSTGRPAAQPAARETTATQPSDGSPQIAALERQLRNLESQLAMGRIVAPFDAIVAETYVDPSAMAPPSSPAIRIVEDAAPQIKVAVPRALAERLEPDQPARVRVGEQSIECRVKTIAIEERPVGSRFVWLQTEQPSTEGSWSLGQTVATSFVLPAQRSGFWLPQSALTRAANGLWSVYVVADPAKSEASMGEFTLTRKIVEVLQLHDNWALVQGDLRRADMVVANGPHRVVAGQAVRIEDATDSFLAPGSAGASE